MLQRGDLAFQPAREGLGIVLRGLAKSEGVADLCPVICDGSAAPNVAAPGCGGHANLAGDCLDRSDGDLLRSARKPPLGLKHLKQHGEAQPRGTDLVAEQCAVGRTQRPTIVRILLAIPVDHSSRLRCAALSQTAGTQAGTRVRKPADEESSTGTACRRLLSGLDRRSVLCSSGTGPHRICRPRRLRGGRCLQGDRVRREARPRGAAQGHGTCPGTSDRCRTKATQIA
jgi:hypothetical protein